MNRPCRALLCALLSIACTAQAETNVVSVLRVLHAARTATGEADLERALKLADSAVERDPAFAQVWKQKGRVEMLLGRRDAAMQSLRMAVALNPQDGETAAWQTHLRLQSDDPTVIRAALLEGPAAAIAAIEPRGLLRRLERHGPALGKGGTARLYRTLAAKLGEPLLAELAALLEIENPERARDTWRDIVRSAEAGPLAHAVAASGWRTIGHAFLRRDDAHAAIGAFERRCALEPESRSAQRDLGWACRRVAPARAAGIWEDAVIAGIAPDSWRIWAAESWLQAKEPQLARAAIRRYTQAHPGEVGPNALRIALDRFLDPDSRSSTPETSPLGQLAEARLAQLQGDDARAVDILSALLRQDPGNAEVRRLLIQTSEQWLTRDDAEDVVKPIRVLLDAGVKRPGLYRDLAWALWEQGLHDEAIRQFDEAIRRGVAGGASLAYEVLAVCAEHEMPDIALKLATAWLPEVSLRAIGNELRRRKRETGGRLFLREAWLARPDPVYALGLAAFDVRRGYQEHLPQYLEAVLTSDLSTAPASHLELLFQTLQKAGYGDRLERIALTVAERVSGDPRFSSRAADLLWRHVRRHTTRHRPERALSLAGSALRGDPASTSWTELLRLARTDAWRGRVSAQIQTHLETYPDRGTAVGMRAVLAEWSGHFAEAATGYARALTADPNQPFLRAGRIRCLLTLNDWAGAHREVDALRGADRDSALLRAEAQRLLGMREAVDAWQALHKTRPDVPAYAVALAKALLAHCEAATAATVLSNAVTQTEYLPAMELLAELEWMLGHTNAAAHWVAEIQAIQPSPRWYAHAAKRHLAAGDAEAALEAARAGAQLNPASGLLAQLHGDGLQALGRDDEAAAHYELHISRAPGWVPGLKALYEIERAREQAEAARRWADALERLAPDTPRSAMRSALALAEAQRFGEALARLSHLADAKSDTHVAVLWYSDVVGCDYAARTRASQVTEHITTLTEAGLHLVTPAQLEDSSSGRRAILIIDGADVDAVHTIDAALRRVDGRAVYVAGESSPLALEDRARWFTAVTHDAGHGRVRIDAAGNRAPSLVHRQWTEKGLESDAAYHARVTAELDALRGRTEPDIAALFYPAGDDGRHSLNALSRDTSWLRAAVEQRFSFAFVSDPDGFASGPSSYLALPARHVAPDVSGPELLAWLRTQNPVARARLERAKVLYRNREYEYAGRALDEAEDAGASPAAVHVQRAANALAQGHLRHAQSACEAAAAVDNPDRRLPEVATHVAAQLRPRARLSVSRADDSESREWSSAKASIAASPSPSLRISAGGGHRTWTAPDGRDVAGGRASGGLRYFSPRPGTWIDANIYGQALDAGSDYVGGALGLRIPAPGRRGHLWGTVTRDRVDTAEAVRAGINEHALTGGLFLRLGRGADVDAWVRGSDYSDGNSGWQVNGRAVWRLRDDPYLGAGYTGRLGDTKMDPLEYWVPEELEQHQIYVTLRHTGERIRLRASGRAGAAREAEGDWKEIWGVRVQVEAALGPHASLLGEYIYQESDTYDKNTALAGLTLRF